MFDIDSDIDLKLDVSPPGSGFIKAS